jgi:hypothetical protein
LKQQTPLSSRRRPGPITTDVDWQKCSGSSIA